MSLFKVSILVFSSISFHLALGYPPSINSEDKIMVTSIRERIWRHLGVPSNIFLKVLLLKLRVTMKYSPFQSRSGHDMASHHSGVDGHH